ncbi:MAG: penicillin-binding protein 2 [Candidatus Moranbacteria bacterium]|nr:penicillin-binding protein 2 [Candidatus Moranbacteria bacterium]
MLKRYFKKRRMARGVEIEDAIMNVEQKEKAIIEKPFKRSGLSVVWYLTFAVLLFLFIRVFYLDIISGNYYAVVSAENRIRKIVIKAPRGNILDKFGNVLARNSPSIDVVVLPSYLPKSGEEKKVLAGKVANILNLNSGNVEIALLSQNEKSTDPILLKENITQDQSLILAEKINELPGIALDKTAIRSYENSSIFSNFIGYDGKITKEEMDKNSGYSMTDYIGKTGLEKSYEQDLKGVYGAQQVEVDSRGAITKNLGVISPQAGNDLVLNIDQELQKKIYDSLSTMLEKGETKTAAAVAIDPSTGGILAMVSLPSYDNNSFARGISSDEYKNLISDKNLPLFNRATSGEYPPGSTIKPAVAAAALSEGTITPTTIINGQGGSINIGGFHFGDWKAHDPSDVRTAIAQSNDVFFYTVGGGYGNITGLGMDRMKKYENLFGFGAAAGIDLPNESKGFIPSEQWKLDKLGEKWYIGDSYHCAIGQGFVLATPLQLANYTAAIANGGTLYSPKLVNRIRKSDGTDSYVQPEIIRKNFIAPDIMQIVREGMRQTITAGTAQVLKTLPVAVAGKTGTAQFGTENKTHAWFISFAPYDNPKIAMVVLVEGGGEGNSSAVPVTKEVYDWYFSQDRK